MTSVPNIGLREGKGRCYTFLKTDASEEIESVRRWLVTVGRFVAIRDLLPITFALDYDRENGDPARPRTRIGALRSRAKPYGTSPSADTYIAAQDLAQACIAALGQLTCYSAVDCVIAVPASKIDKPFDLPRYVAHEVASSLGKDDLTAAMRTIRDRPSLKDLSLAEKMQALEGTVEVDRSVGGRRILLLDDLYQSGITMNYSAMMLQLAGAKTVFGLACEKTVRNDDNA
jgi:hypothetical protein